MSERWAIVSLDELESPPLVNASRWTAIRRHFGIESFGVNAWGADEAGEDVIAEHDEVSGGAARHEELYIVLDGRATFTVDGETIDGPPGTVVFVREPAAKRRAVADEPHTRILAVGAPRGEAFVRSTWERSAPSFPFFASGDYDRAIEVLEEALEEDPGDGAVLYNLACAESMSGRTAEAVEHLRRALGQSERFRELAEKDSDFDAIRDEPEFKALF